ncbi:GNAT family N-acetyltransferase [Vagococcus sp.]|uniref:GNAT family N-acetyltransferase n=1 Tax=Vagococcus sp. TaxID=1933889 RepID=UPI003F9C6AC1
MGFRFKLKVDDKISLVYPTLELAPLFFEVIDSDRMHLERFLPFVEATKTVEDERKYLEAKLNGVAKGTDAIFFIEKEEQLVGCIDLHFIDRANARADVGYWLHSGSIGQGVMTKCVLKLIAFAFDELKLNKLNLVADTQNLASNQVAKKTGFRLVGVDLEDQWVRGEFRDMNRYERLRSSQN